MALVGSEIRTWFIYRITNPNGRVYIGKTCILNKRINHYRTANCKSQPIVLSSIKKYGFNNHKFDIIDSFISSNSYASGKEIFWIRTYMCDYSKYPDQKGMNLTMGGEGTIGLKKTKEQIEHLRKIALARPPVKQETKDKISAFHKGNKYSLGKKRSQGWKDLMSKINKGNAYAKGTVWSSEAVERKRLTLLGRVYTQESLNKMKIAQIKKRGKAILQYDLQGNFIKEYITITEAVEKIPINRSNIKKVLRGVQSSTNGFVFKYKKDNVFHRFQFQRRVFNLKQAV